MRCEGKGVYFPVDIVLNGEERKIFEDLKIRSQTKANEFNLPAHDLQ